jgi:N-acetylglucosamine-6-phosphate deacetylase
MTLAPELHGAFELIGELVGRGVTVSCGHSDATAAEAHLAFDRGARTVTHLFNAMRPSVPRDPGIAMAALARPDVTVQVIVDGHHLAGETVLVRLAGGTRALRAGNRRRGRGGHGRRELRAGRDRGHAPRAAWCAAATGRSPAAR